MSTTSKFMCSVHAFCRLPKDTSKGMEPTGSILFPLKPYNNFFASFNCFLSNPIWLKAKRNKISRWLPLLIRTLVMSHLSMRVVMTMTYVCRKDMSLMSASVKVRGM
jgi:hypothetical protein